jgi:hypothetical protein
MLTYWDATPIECLNGGILGVTWKQNGVAKRARAAVDHNEQSRARGRVCSSIGLGELKPAISVRSDHERGRLRVQPLTKAVDGFALDRLARCRYTKEAV